MRRFMLGALIGAATVALSGVAFAGSAAESEHIYAAVKKADGTMRWSEDGTYDAQKETLLSWNVQGVQGSPGPAGERGPQGPPGPAGETDTTVTQGSFTVPVGEKVSKTLPLTGITVSGTTQVIPPEHGGGLIARPLLEAASMDVFVVGGGTPGAGPSLQSLLLNAVGYSNPDGKGYYAYTVIATADGATATITIGGTADMASGVCTFTWMAIETPNQ
jgi:hypothetical protein